MLGNSPEKAGRPISTETAPALRSPIKLKQMICKTSTVCGRAFLWTGQHCTDGAPTWQSLSSTWTGSSQRGTFKGNFFWLCSLSFHGFNTLQQEPGHVPLCV